jgi:hypothetical protein
MRINTPMDLPTLQREYDAMKKVALQSISRDIDLDPKFELELTLLMRTVKAMGGKV